MLKSEYLTPPWILDALGEFDLDPCAPVKRPWDMAKKHYTRHQNCIVLTFARTETKMFFNWIWNLAIAVLFIEGRITFYDVNGHLVRTRNGKVANSGAPSVLIAYDHSNAESLRDSGIKGKFLWINK
jgi:hypothetical protein